NFTTLPMFHLVVLFTIPQFSTHFFFFLLIHRLPRSTLFPYTTLFRSTPDDIEYSWLRPRGWFSVVDADDVRRDFLCRERRTSLRSEEHTSELQSRGHLVCRLLLEKKKQISSPST